MICVSNSNGVYTPLLNESITPFAITGSTGNISLSNVGFRVRTARQCRYLYRLCACRYSPVGVRCDVGDVESRAKGGSSVCTRAVGTSRTIGSKTYFFTIDRNPCSVGRRPCVLSRSSRTLCCSLCSISKIISGFDCFWRSGYRGRSRRGG